MLQAGWFWDRLLWVDLFMSVFWHECGNGMRLRCDLRYAFVAFSGYFVFLCFCFGGESGVRAVMFLRGEFVGVLDRSDLRWVGF